MKTIKNFSKFVAAAIIVLGGSTAIAGNLTIYQVDCVGNKQSNIIESKITSIEVTNGTLDIRTENSIIEVRDYYLRNSSFTAESLAILLQGGADISIASIDKDRSFSCREGTITSIKVTQRL
jgi:hypothetical protein